MRTIDIVEKWLKETGIRSYCENTCSGKCCVHSQCRKQYCGQGRRLLVCSIFLCTLVLEKAGIDKDFYLKLIQKTTKEIVHPFTGETIYLPQANDFDIHLTKEEKEFFTNIESIKIKLNS